MKSSAFKLTVAAVVTACTLTSCSTVSVTTDYDHSAPFGKYRTYSIAPAAGGQVLPPSSEAALRDALRTELGARGLSETANAKADLAIVRHAFLQNKISVQQYTDWGYGYRGGMWPYGYGYYGMWAGAPLTYTSVSEYTEGTLVIDVVDTHAGKLVFRGIGTAVVDGSAGNGDKIREAVKKMVKALPPAAAH